METKKKLPVGIQTFSKIREEDYLYIDKTREAYELIRKYEYVFLSRPRRFGKSLFLDTLKNIFEGNKHYFKGLYIEDKYDFSTTYPVIKISFAGSLQTKEGLEGVFTYLLQENMDALGVSCDNTLDPPNCLSLLIRKAYEKYKAKVVVLVDEYDKPILDNITNPEMALYAKERLKSLYEVLKKSDTYIRFVFLTGVSKFSKVSIFSGLNNLEDITLNPKFGNICGYTHSDIETHFRPLLEGVDLEELKAWYNGYNFLKDKVYNPFDILLFIRNDFLYKNYWFETGSPSFLFKLIKQKNYYLPDLQNIIAKEELFNSFEIDNIKIETVLFQAGYLTIQEVMQNPRGGLRYALTVPNKEVQQSLSDAILYMLVDDNTVLPRSQDSAYYALHDARLDNLHTALLSLFASLPYQNYASNNINVYEGFYASIVYVYLLSMGCPVSVEESTNRGRLDMSILLNNNRYVIEFKVDGTSNALAQIKANKYYEKFLDEQSTVYLVGIHFSKETKNISLFEWEQLRELS